MLSSRVCQIAKKTAPLEGAIHLAASLRSLVGVVVMVMVMMMEFVLMMLNIRLCTWDRADRERNGGDGGQNESKFSHLKYSSPSFLSDQKMAKASAHVKWIFMNGRSGTRVHGWTTGREQPIAAVHWRPRVGVCAWIEGNDPSVWKAQLMVGANADCRCFPWSDRRQDDAIEPMRTSTLGRLP